MSLELVPIQQTNKIVFLEKSHFLWKRWYEMAFGTPLLSPAILPSGRAKRRTNDSSLCQYLFCKIFVEGRQIEVMPPHRHIWLIYFSLLLSEYHRSRSFYCFASVFATSRKSSSRKLLQIFTAGRVITIFSL